MPMGLTYPYIPYHWHKSRVAILYMYFSQDMDENILWHQKPKLGQFGLKL